MDESTWKVFQIFGWVIGIQTVILISILGGLWAFVWSLKKGQDKLNENLTDMDRRLCRIEGAITQKEYCVLKSNEQIKENKG